MNKFWDKVKKGKPDECWEWQGSCTAQGYGQFYAGRGYRAHRLSWELTNKKEIPKGMLACHHCDNPKCVNPNHLFIGTYKDNAQDALKKGRASNNSNREVVAYAKCEKHGSAKLTKEQVKAIRNDPRSTYVLAKVYNVHRSLIGYIKQGKIWKEV